MYTLWNQRKWQNHHTNYAQGNLGDCKTTLQTENLFHERWETKMERTLVQDASVPPNVSVIFGGLILIIRSPIMRAGWFIQLHRSLLFPSHVNDVSYCVSLVVIRDKHLKLYHWQKMPYNLVILNFHAFCRWVVLRKGVPRGVTGFESVLLICCQ